MNSLPYDRNPELNAILSELMDDWVKLVNKAKEYGLDIRLYPDSETLELYFHCDYPDTILVDKDASSKKKSNVRELLNTYGSLDVAYPETVGQFTGVYDRNGRRIFEDDIVKAMMDYGPAGMPESIVRIYFDPINGYQWQYFDMDTIEIIGNIHDNPELLGGA